ILPAMGPILHRLARTAQVAALGGTAGLSSFFIYTRKDELVPIEPTDRIFRIVREQNWNPHGNPFTQDFFVRRVPLNQIRPELRDQPDKLTDAFCAGVWSNWGFFLQRTLLNALARNPSNEKHLWTREDFMSSTYEPGTLMADSFEVLEKTDGRIVIRGGDHPSKRDTRPMDAILELTSVMKEDQTIEFGFKSLFYTGDTKTGQPPMPWPVVWLHLQYAKLLLESGISNTTI
ncbi:hypothetical protein N7462_007938, partial [Penicillium macrosclerotiorum]|uniref:uncharacterized protein n=1 Tax=Penicillium macrosclerotiorum TaxID=303699 RepID=UPI002549B9D6